MNIETVTLTVQVLKSKRKNAKVLYEIEKRAWLNTFGSDRLKSRITDDNLSELQWFIKEKFEHGNVLTFKLYNTYYGYNSQLNHRMYRNDNDAILAIRNLVATANGQAEHIETIINQ